jgi:hypothetical protein
MPDQLKPGERVRTNIDEIDDDDGVKRTTPAGTKGIISHTSNKPDQVCVTFDNGACLHYTLGEAEMCLDRLPDEPLRKFNVRIARVFTQRMTIEVEAANDLEATDKANDTAGDHDFNAGTSSDCEYVVEDVTEISKGTC